MAPPRSDGDVTLRQYVRIVRTRKWTIIFTTALMVLLALFYSSRQTPQYQSSAKLLVKANPSLGYFPNAEDESAVVDSAPVATLVTRELNLQTKPGSLLGGLTAQRVSPTSDVITITYTSTDPAQARAIANSFATNYLKYRRDQALEELETEQDAIQDKLLFVRSQIGEVIEGLEEARAERDRARIARLETRRSALSARLGILQQELDNLRGTATLGTAIGEVLEPAIEPGTPSSPDHRRNGILGFFGGLLLGVGLALLRERLDDRFHGRADVEDVLEAPVIATVPKFPTHRRDSDLVMMDDPKGSASEAYRNMRTGLQFILAQIDEKRILVTSPSASEGKSTTAANLAIALAKTGKRVILVSADLRRPSLEKKFGTGKEPGLSNWLFGEVDRIKDIVRDPGIPSVRIIPSGPVPSNPAELLTSPRLTALLVELEARADYVVVDTPPTLPVADSIILASHVPVVLLVLDASRTGRAAALHTKQQLTRVGANIAGVVLNSFDPSSSPYYYEPSYYYGSAYYQNNSQAEDIDGLSPEPQVPAVERRKSRGRGNPREVSERNS